MAKKIFVTEKLVDFDVAEGKTIRQLILALEEIENEWTEKGYYNIRVKDGGYYDYTEYEFHGDREETDKEQQKRLVKEEKERKQHKKQALKREESEKALLAKLKAKYETNI